MHLYLFDRLQTILRALRELAVAVFVPYKDDRSNLFQHKPLFAETEML